MINIGNYDFSHSSNNFSNAELRRNRNFWLQEYGPEASNGAILS